MNNSILSAIDVVLKAICSFFVFVMALLLIVQVVMRYGFNASFFWIEEVCTYLLVSVCFLGGALAFGRREHITVDFIFDVLPPKGNAVLRYLLDFIIFAFCLWAFFASCEYVAFSMRKKSFTTGLPTGVGYVCVPVAFLLICVQCVTFAYMRVTGRTEVRFNDSVLD